MNQGLSGMLDRFGSSLPLTPPEWGYGLGDLLKHMVVKKIGMDWNPLLYDVPQGRLDEVYRINNQLRQELQNLESQKVLTYR